MNVENVNLHLSKTDDNYIDFINIFPRNFKGNFNAIEI